MKPSIFVVLATLLLSCNFAKEKAKETANKAGEIVAKTGSEFADGVHKGVEKTFSNEVVLSKELHEQALTTGKIIINSTDSSSDNIISAYLIFGQDFNKTITVKVLSPEGQEYGRTTLLVAGSKGTAKYFDFVFDKRTNIEGKSTLMFQ